MHDPIRPLRPLTGLIALLCAGTASGQARADTFYQQILALQAPDAHWSLDATSGAIPDESGNGHTATPDGSPGYGAPALLPSGEGRAVALSDGNRFEVPAFEKLPPGATGYTVSYWIRIDAMSGTYTQVVGDGVGSGTFYMMSYLERSGGEACPRPHYGVANGGWSPSPCTLGATLTPGEVHHVATTWDMAAGISTTWIDGVATVQLDKPTGTPTLTDLPLFIGGDDRTDGWDIVVDEVAFWSRPLGPLEIAAQVHAGSGDTDGDGVADAVDPCPSDAADHCWQASHGETDQSHHGAYLGALVGATEGEVRGFSLAGRSRVLVRTYDSANAGTNADVGVSGFNSSGGWGVSGGTHYYQLNTAGDNLEREHIDTFWYSINGKSDFSLAEYCGSDDRSYDGRNGDWFKADTTVMTYAHQTASTWGEPRNFATLHNALDTYSFHPGWPAMDCGNSVPPTEDVDVFALVLSTLDASGAGTDEHMRARLVWEDGETSDWMRLGHPWKDDFEEGDTEVYFLPVMAPPAGDPVDVELWHDTSQLYAIDELVLAREVPAADDAGLELDVLLRSEATMAYGSGCAENLDGCVEMGTAVADAYRLVAQTGTRGHASSDSAFYARLRMSDGRATGTKRLDRPGDTFEEGAVETFTLHAPRFWAEELGLTVEQVEIWTHGSDGWRPRSIQLVDEGDPATTADDQVLIDKGFGYDTFTIDDDCDADVTDNCAPEVGITTAGTLVRP